MRWTPWAVLALIVLGLILVPFFLWEQPIQQRIQLMLHSSAPPAAIALAVIVLLALDIFLPIPSSVVSTAAGAALGFTVGTAVSALGMSLGCLLGYWAGRRYGIGAVRRMVRPREYEFVSERLRRNAWWTLALLRPVPVLAEASALFAGVARVPLAAYLGITACANAGISAVYSAAGVQAFTSGSILVAFAGAIAVPGLAMLAARLLQKSGRVNRSSSGPFEVDSE